MNTQSVSRMFRATCICGAVESRRATSQEEADRLLGGHRVPTWPSLMVLAPEGKLGVVKSTLDGALAGLLNGMFVSVVVPEKCAVVMVPTAASYVTGPSAVDLGPALERFGASIGTIETPGAGSFCCSARCMAGCVRQSLIGKRSIDASGTFTKFRADSLDPARWDEAKQADQAKTAAPVPAGPPVDDWAARRANEAAHFARQQAARDAADQAARDHQAAITAERDRRIAEGPPPPARDLTRVVIRCSGCNEPREAAKFQVDDPAEFALWCERVGFIRAPDGRTGHWPCVRGQGRSGPVPFDPRARNGSGVPDLAPGEETYAQKMYRQKHGGSLEEVEASRSQAPSMPAPGPAAPRATRRSVRGDGS
jgi:hypothetical protein